MNLFIHMDIDSSKNCIQDGMNTFSCAHSTQKSYVVNDKNYLKGMGGSAVNLIAEHIFSKLFPDINWLTQIEHLPKISIGFF